MKNLILCLLVFTSLVTKAQVPNEPTNLVVTPITTGGMVQFTAPSNDGGSIITNYEYSTDGGANWVTPSPAIIASPLIISSGLTNCTTYSIKLRAVNAAGSGTASASASLTPIASIVQGINWTARTSAADNSWYGVTYGNGVFVAVSGSGSGNRVMTSPDGITWTSRTSAANNFWNSVTYGNGLFVAVSETGSSNRVMTSPDGITWTSRTSAADNSWISVTYGNNLFVAVAYSGINNRVMTSPDGINWTTRTSASNNNWTCVTYGNGLFVAVAATGTNRVMTSPNGINWTTRTPAVDNGWNSVTYGNGLFVAVSSNGIGNRVMTSPNGITWTSRTSAAENSWNSVTYGNGLFVAVSSTGSGNRVMTSPDGIIWTSRTSAANNSWRNLTYGNGLFVASSTSGSSNRVMTSSYAVAADAPVIGSATFGSSTTVNFTQTSAVLAPSITNYEYSTDNGSNWTAVSPAVTTSPLTITGLAAETSTIILRAVNSVGNSCPSNNYSSCIPTAFFADADGDGYGNNAVSQQSCTQPTDYVANNTDCDDTNAAIHPGAVDICYDGLDNDCDGTIDNGCVPLVSTVQTAQCGQTLASIDSYVYANLVNGAQGYRFKVTNMVTNQVQTIDRFLRVFRITQLPNYAFNTEYQVEVTVRKNNVWQPFYGAPCMVKTPANTTQLVNCGANLTAMTDVIYANLVPFATGYRFRVTNILNPLDTQVINRSLREFRMSLLTDMQYSTTCNVEVAVRDTDGVTYLPYGPICEVTTPIFPASYLQDSQCDDYEVPSTNTILYAQSFTGAEGYRFRLQNLGEGYTQEVDRNLRTVRLSDFTGLAPGATYTVKVALKINGIWGSFTGKSCSIITPGGARAIETEAIVVKGNFAAVAYPNPFASTFAIKVQTLSQEVVQLKVYDMVGRLVDQRETTANDKEATMFGERYPSGVYSVIVTQGNVTETLRVIKR